MAVDALSEALGVGAYRPSDLMMRYGSATFLILVQDQRPPDSRLWTQGGALSRQA